MRRPTLRRLFWVFGMLACLFAPLAARAQNSSISEGYNTADTGIVAGALVGLESGTTHSAQLATLQNAANLIGVAGDNATVALSDSANQVQVITTGTADVLVSDLEGDIQPGDKIAPSLIAGVGAKAASSGQIVGTAQAKLDIANAKTQQVTDQNGVVRTAHIAKIPVQIGVEFYSAPGSSFIPPFVQGAADAIAGHSVSVLRVLAASVVIMLAIVSSSVILYISIRSALTAIGRNPLATGQVRRGLLQIGLAVLAIWAGSGVTAYFIIVL